MVYTDFMIEAVRGDTIPFDFIVTRPKGLAAVATVAGGAVTAITVLNGIPTDGSRLPVAPLVKIVGNGTGATATATVANNTVTGITVTAGGTGYTWADVIVGPVDLTGATIICTGRRSLSEASGAYVFRLTLGSGITVTTAANGQGSGSVPPSATSGMADWPTLYVDIETTEASGRVSTPLRGRIKLSPDASRV